MNFVRPKASEGGAIPAFQYLRYSGGVGCHGRQRHIKTMTTFIDCKYTCPSCAHELNMLRIGSVFIADKTHYSDGYVFFSHGGSDCFDYIGCPKCATIFHKRREGVVLHGRPEFFEVETDAELRRNERDPLDILMTIKLLLEYATLSDDHREEILRAYMYAVNHASGTRGAFLSRQHCRDWKKNMRAYAALLAKKKGVKDALQRAEVLRECQAYAESIEVLDAIDPKELEPPELDMSNEYMPEIAPKVLAWLREGNPRYSAEVRRVFKVSSGQAIRTLDMLNNAGVLVPDLRKIHSTMREKAVAEIDEPFVIHDTMLVE